LAIAPFGYPPPFSSAPGKSPPYFVPKACLSMAIGGPQRIQADPAARRAALFDVNPLSLDRRK